MSTPAIETPFTKHVGIDYPVICGAMYPCSNPELIGAVSGAGGIGIVQPLSLVYVYEQDFRAGLRRIKELSGGKPFGFNAIVEKAAKPYEKRMRRWIEISLEEGCRFFITALGDPKWVVDQAHQVGGVVYHDVTERKWADKALSRGVDGLICVNADAGGHAGNRDPRRLFDELSGLGVPLICAGGVGEPSQFVEALEMGYAGVQLGTRFIATTECGSHADYKRAICDAKADDIVLTERISGVPVAVIKTPFVEKIGTKAGPIARLLLKGRKTKHLMRALYMLKSVWSLKRSSLRGISYQDFFQAGKSVQGIDEVISAAEVVRQFAQAAHDARQPESAEV